jgi:hypothetical protein
MLRVFLGERNHISQGSVPDLRGIGIDGDATATSYPIMVGRSIPRRSPMRISLSQTRKLSLDIV